MLTAAPLVSIRFPCPPSILTLAPALTTPIPKLPCNPLIPTLLTMPPAAAFTTPAKPIPIKISPFTVEALICSEVTFISSAA